MLVTVGDGVRVAPISFGEPALAVIAEIDIQVRTGGP